MNLNDKNIDQIFRDAAQNTDAPRYDHSYWNEMSSVLNSQDKRKRGFILWSVAGSAVALLLFSALFISNNNTSDTQLANNDNTLTQTSEGISKGKQIDKTSSAESSKTVALEKDNSANTFNNKSVSPSLQSSISNKDLGPKTKRLASHSDGQLIPNENSDNGINRAAVDNEKIENSKEDISKKNIAKKEDISREDQIVKNTSESNDELAIHELSPKIISMQSFDAGKELLPIQIMKDSPINFYAKLSAGLMENYETSRPFESGLFDLSLNIEYAKEQVLFRTGVGIQATSNADLVVSERAKVYGFGITTHQNNLSYQSLYDLYIPIELGYKLNNTSFGFGAQFNYMLGTTMNYESLENKVVVEEYKLKGFAEGLNALTAQGYVWLEQKLTDRFSAGVKVGTNLNSRIKEGKYFNESATTNPLYGQLTLRYNINK